MPSLSTCRSVLHRLTHTLSTNQLSIHLARGSHTELSHRAKLISLVCILFLALAKPTTEAKAQTYPSVTPASVGEAWGQTLGLTMFRGNPTRTFYGTGPLPRQTPRQLWRYPDRPMCSESCVGQKCSTWCGSGWTGQPVVWERPDGITEVIFGAYDRQVHFVDAQTGRPTRAPFPTGDIIKGSVTLDPDGFPLLYFGSRDNKYRVLALDQEPVREVYSLNAHQVARRLWNDDWDGNASIVEDRLFIGGENSWFYVVKLNRSRDAQGRVRVQPDIEVQMPGWTPEMHSQLGNNMLSIESSVAVFGNRAYWTNSGGMVVGVDWTRVRNKQAEVVFTYWVGDDVDATPVIDERGHLYIAAEYELEQGRGQRASRQRIEDVGQLIKLDPHNPLNPKLWSLAIPPRGGDGKGGIWSTPALDLKRNQIIVTTHPGDLIILDRDTGREKHRQRLGFHEWSSPIVIGDDLLLGRCQKTGLEMWDLSSPGLTSLWSTRSPTGCVESTPAVWRGRIYVGSRDGYFYAFGP